MVISAEDIQALCGNDYYTPFTVTSYGKKETKTPLQMVREFADTMGQKKDPFMSASLIREECLEWDDEWSNYQYKNEDYNPEKELKELTDLVYVVFGYANSRDWDLDKALERVHHNNMNRCIWPDGSIKRREDGKVLKNPDAPKIDLSDLV